LSQTAFGIRVVALLVTVCGAAEARPLDVRESYPAAEMIVDGRSAQYVVRFDGPVDHAASRISPSWSTARHRYIRLPAIRTTISSRCHRSVEDGSAAAVEQS
jgi:hypothetical protein